MPKKPEDLPDFDATEMAFNVEAARSYLFRTAGEIFDNLQKGEIAHAPSIILTALAEATAQMWATVAHESNIDHQKSRMTLIREINTLYAKHKRLAKTPARGELN